MTHVATDAIVAALVRARREAEPAKLAPDWAVTDLDAAYGIQQAVASRLGAVRGWKVSALTVAQQRAMGVDAPVAAPLIDGCFGDSGAAFSLDAFCGAPLLECEFAFVLGTDLPPRAEPYRRAEVEAAIASVHPALEICDSRIAPAASTLQQLADGFNNGAFVLGAPCADWRGVDYRGHAIALRAAGGSDALATGSGAAILDGDPVGAVVAMANLRPYPKGGLRAGDVITTGSCIVPWRVSAEGEFVGDFGSLGTVHVRFGSDAPARDQDKETGT